MVLSSSFLVQNHEPRTTNQERELRKTTKCERHHPNPSMWEAPQRADNPPQCGRCVPYSGASERFHPAAGNCPRTHYCRPGTVRPTEAAAAVTIFFDFLGVYSIPLMLSTRNTTSPQPGPAAHARTFRLPVSVLLCTTARHKPWNVRRVDAPSRV